MTEDLLAQQLRATADTAFPEALPLVDGVVAALEGHHQPRRRLVVAVAVAAVVVLAVLAFPAPRQALARLLGIGGVAIERVGSYELPEAAATDAPLGRQVDLADATELVGFTPLLPEVPGLDNPTVFVRTDVADGLVSLVYGNADGDPGLIITEFRTAGQVAIKQLSEQAQVRDVTIAGDTVGFWIEGTHTISFFGDDDAIVRDSARLVGNTLVWEDEGLTIRIESALALDDALQIARSLAG